MTNVSDLTNRLRVDVVGFNADLLPGVVQYVREHPDCPFRPQYQTESLLHSLDTWEGGGLIVHVFFPWLQDQLRLLGKPVVNVSQTLEGLRIPSVVFDSPAIGRMGAEYLMRLGLRHFAFVGEEGYYWSGQRQQGT